MALALIALAFALALPPSAAAQNVRMTGQSGSQGGYMSQTYVDTTILRAFYVLTEASGGFSPNANRQEHAIKHAKNILADLRRQAKGDPNERYAAMKIQEVEAQIFLEEEEMRQIRAERNQLVSNHLVIQYNGELSKARPDFATMRGLYLRMAEVDARQANNLASSYNKSHRYVAQEAQKALEKALAANDYAAAAREIEYIDKNKNYLQIPSSTLDAQRERVNRLSGAHSDLPHIITALEAGEAAYKGYKLSESRQNLTMAQNRLREIRASLQQKEANALTARIGLAIKALDRREDSLVSVALSVMDAQGPDAAIEYFQEVLQRRMQLSQERSAIVDQVILQARPDFTPKYESTVKMVDLDDHSGESLSSMQDMARSRAQARADSLRVIRDRAANIRSTIYTLIDKNRKKDAERLFNRDKAFLASVLDKKEADLLDRSIKKGVNLTSPESVKKMETAEVFRTRIHKLIEENHTKEAAKRFKKHRKNLQRYLDNESFKTLEAAVTQASKKK